MKLNKTTYIGRKKVLRPKPAMP